MPFWLVTVKLILLPAKTAFVLKLVRKINWFS